MSDAIPHLSQKKLHVMKSSRIILIIALVIALASLGTGGYFYYQYQQNSPQNIAQRSRDEAKKLADEIGKIMLLPSDEIPTVATVTDISKLSNQDFFKFARNGDKVLIYTKAKMAILYNPSLHKIINVGPVNIGAQPNQAPQAKIAILNGTVVDGLAAKEQTNIQNAFPGANIVKTGQANSTNYEKTLVIPLNPIAKSAAQTIANFYNGTVATLPGTESPQDGVDILIILGKERGNSATAASSPTVTKSPSPTPGKK